MKDGERRHTRRLIAYTRDAKKTNFSASTLATVAKRICFRRHGSRGEDLFAMYMIYSLYSRPPPASLTALPPPPRADLTFHHFGRLEFSETKYAGIREGAIGRVYRVSLTVCGP